MEKTEVERAEEFKQEGNEFFKKKEYTKAIQCYTEAINLNGIEPSYYGNRAACYLGLNQFDKCIKDCDETLNIDPKFGKAWIRKARAQYYLGLYQEAKKAFSTAIEIDPKDASLPVELRTVSEVERMMHDAKQYLDAGKFTDALMDVKQSLKLCPLLVPGKILYVEVLARKGQTPEAIERSSEYLKELMGNTDYLFARGLALYYDGQPENAKKTWKEAMRLDPDNQKCKDAIKRMNRQEEFKEKGNNAFKDKDYVNAITFYTEGIEQDINNKNLVSQMFNNRALCYLRTKQQDKALEDCNKAIELNSNYAKAYMRRGDILVEMEKFEEATRDYTQAHQLDPNIGAKQKIKETEKAAKMAARKDYYKILEVDKNATDDEIKKAYKKQALKWHPDKNGQDEETRTKAEAKFKDVNEAYTVLSDPQKKARYDSGEDLNDMGGFGDSGGIDPNIIFQTFFGGGGGDFGGGFPGGFFSGGGGGRQKSSGGFPGGFSFSFSSK